MAMLMKKCYVRLGKQCRYNYLVSKFPINSGQLTLLQGTLLFGLLVSHSMHSGQLSTAPRDTIVRDFIVDIGKIVSEFTFNYLLI